MPVVTKPRIRNVSKGKRQRVPPTISILSGSDVEDDESDETYQPNVSSRSVSDTSLSRSANNMTPESQASRLKQGSRDRKRTREEIHWLRRQGWIYPDEFFREQSETGISFYNCEFRTCIASQWSFTLFRTARPAESFGMFVFRALF